MSLLRLSCDVTALCQECPASQESRIVTLNKVKGPTATRGARCFAALSMTIFLTIEKPCQRWDRIAEFIS